MRRGWALVALLLCSPLICRTVAVADTMYGATPAPRSTDLGVLRDAARSREIRERFAHGIAALNRNDLPTAVAEFEAVLRRNPPEPQNSTAHYNLARALADGGNLDGAAGELRAALARDPAFLAAYSNLVVVELRRGDLMAAREVADRFLRLAPASARALYSRGLVALQSGDAATAQADFSKLVGSNPAYAPAHYDLALAQLKAGRFQDAERELGAALASLPDYPRARFALGMVLLREGRRDEARSAFERVTREASDPGLRNLALSMRDTLSPR